MQTHKYDSCDQTSSSLTPRAQDLARVLIVSDNDSETERLKTAFRDAELTSESTNSMTAGCALAESGRFQVVFSTPLLGDGSWKRLIEVASQHNLGFEVVLLARTFTFDEWAEALQIGAFDVLDVLCDLPKAAEAARRASGSFFLRHFWAPHEPV